MYKALCELLSSVFPLYLFRAYSKLWGLIKIGVFELEYSLFLYIFFGNADVDNYSKGNFIVHVNQRNYLSSFQCACYFLTHQPTPALVVHFINSVPVHILTLNIGHKSPM